MPWADVAVACAPTVAQVTVERVIGVESGGNPLALHVNGLVGPQPRASNISEAAAVARRFIDLGYSVDLGPMQVNSRNLPMLGYSIDQVLDPCINLRAGGAILTAAYNQALLSKPPGQEALRTALSLYNTGDEQRGFRNGYVARYYVNIPALPSNLVASVVTPKPKPKPNPYTADAEVWFAAAGGQ